MGQISSADTGETDREEWECSGGLRNDDTGSWELITLNNGKSNSNLG